MTPVELVSALALALRDVIQTTPDDSLSGDPEEIYTNMAARLIVRLAPEVAIIPKKEIETTDGYWQMRAVSDALVHILALYRRENCEFEVLDLAVVDVAVRLKRAAGERATTADLLRQIAVEIREMAQTEEAVDKERQH